MNQIRVERPRRRNVRADAEILPLDPRDPDIVRAKALARAVAKPAKNLGVEAEPGRVQGT
jgi:hypothetical protein